jgi:hypothetical protein
MLAGYRLVDFGAIGIAADDAELTGIVGYA